jgi:hypothetical protein
MENNAQLNARTYEGFYNAFKQGGEYQEEV